MMEVHDEVVLEANQPLVTLAPAKEANSPTTIFHFDEGPRSQATATSNDATGRRDHSYLQVSRHRLVLALIPQ